MGRQQGKERVHGGQLPCRRQRKRELWIRWVMPRWSIAEAIPFIWVYSCAPILRMFDDVRCACLVSVDHIVGRGADLFEAYARDQCQSGCFSARRNPGLRRLGSERSLEALV